MQRAVPPVALCQLGSLQRDAERGWQASLHRPNGGKCHRSLSHPTSQKSRRLCPDILNTVGPFFPFAWRKPLDALFGFKFNFSLFCFEPERGENNQSLFSSSVVSIAGTLGQVAKKKVLRAWEARRLLDCLPAPRPIKHPTTTTTSPPSHTPFP